MFYNSSALEASLIAQDQTALSPPAGGTVCRHFFELQLGVFQQITSRLFENGLTMNVTFGANSRAFNLHSV